MNLSAEPTKNRIEYFDFFRAIAAFCVIIIHVDAQSYYSTDVSSFSWQVLNFFDSITRWAVPTFLMMSGAIFLGKQHSIQKILCKNLLRIVTAFIFWSALYVGIQVYRGEIAGREILRQIIEGHYHLWYLSTIAVLYLTTPILQKITDSKSVIKYTLIAAFLIDFVAPQIADTVALLSESCARALNLMLEKVQAGVFREGVFYYLLGWYLVNTEISQKQRRLIYILGGIGLLYTVLFSSAISIWKGYAINGFYAPYRVNTALYSVAVFVYGKYNLSYQKVGRPITGIMKALAKNSFGIYLSHVMVIEWLNKSVGLNPCTGNPVIMVPAISLIVLLITYMISSLIRHIPVLRKYVV